VNSMSDNYTKQFGLIIAYVLGESNKPMSVSDIVEGVLATGYRSTSPKFRGIVNMTLIKERRRFANAGRGMYTLVKKGGHKK